MPNATCVPYYFDPESLNKVTSLTFSIILLLKTDNDKFETGHDGKKSADQMQIL